MPRDTLLCQLLLRTQVPFGPLLLHLRFLVLELEVLTRTATFFVRLLALVYSHIEVVHVRALDEVGLLVGAGLRLDVVEAESWLRWVNALELFNFQG